MTFSVPPQFAICMLQNNLVDPLEMSADELILLDGLSDEPLTVTLPVVPHQAVDELAIGAERHMAHSSRTIL